jgi:hypothetical protein
MIDFLLAHVLGPQKDDPGHGSAVPLRCLLQPEVNGGERYCWSTHEAMDAGLAEPTTALVHV